MPKRSAHEDPLLAAALELQHELARWGAADLVGKAEELSGSRVPRQVVSRALRRFRDHGWLTAEPTDDAGGLRYLYSFTADGMVAAEKAAGRLVAEGMRWALVPLQHIDVANLAGGRSIP